MTTASERQRRSEADSVTARAVAGDVAAIRQVLERVAPRVHAVSRRVMGPADGELEDVVQESLIALVRALPQYRGEGPVVAFAARIAVRTAVAARKRRHRDRERRRVFEQQAATRSSAAPASRRLGLLRGLLGELPAGQGETLALRVVLGASIAEIAEATEVPVNTVRSRLRLAKEAMRKRIAADPELADALEVRP